MYSLLPVVSSEEAYARGTAMADRARYAKFMEAAEKFAAENELVVGGAGGVRLLLGDPEDPARPPQPSLDAFQYDLYSGHAATAARKLGDTLYQQDAEGLGHYTAVLTKVPGHQLAIEVDGRQMFTVTSLPTHRGVKIADVVIPSYRPSQFARRGPEPLQVACLGPELQLMELYAALCNPGRASDWGALLAAEVRLRALFQKEIRGKFSEVLRATGGRAPVPRRAAFHRDLYDKYATGPGRILIGPAAISLLSEATSDPSLLLEHRVQMATAEPLEAEARELARLAKAHGLELQWAVHDPKVPTDSRLRRLTMYIAGGPRERREPVLDIYNVASHELVPYTTAQALPTKRGGWHPPAALKIGTPFVLLRFRLADMWTIQVLLRMGSVAAAYAGSVLLGMLSDYEAAAAAYEGALREAAENLDAAAARLVPRSSYVGRLENPDLALKRAALERPGAKFHAPYLPAARAAGAASDKEDA